MSELAPPQPVLVWPEKNTVCTGWYAMSAWSGSALSQKLWMLLTSATSAQSSFLFASSPVWQLGSPLTPVVSTVFPDESPPPPERAPLSSRTTMSSTTPPIPPPTPIGIGIPPPRPKPPPPPPPLPRRTSTCRLSSRALGLKRIDDSSVARLGFPSLPLSLHLVTLGIPP